MTQGDLRLTIPVHIAHQQGAGAMGRTAEAELNCTVKRRRIDGTTKRCLSADRHPAAAGLQVHHNVGLAVAIKIRNCNTLCIGVTA